MDVIFRGKHLTIGEPFRAYATRKLDRLARYLPAADHAIVDVRREGKPAGRFVVQVTVSADGTFLRAEERSHELEAAVDAAANVLSRQAERYKQKAYGSLRRPRKAPPLEGGETEPPLPPDVEIVSGRVVRVKRFAMKPVTEAEAIEQMELLGHTFYLFRDDKGGFALLYRRRDGNYGMIIPEVK